MHACRSTLEDPTVEKQHYLFVERASGGPPADDFYLLLHDVMGSTWYESDNNDAPAKASTMETLAAPPGIHRMALEGDVNKAGSDVDHARISLPAKLAKGRIAVRCDAGRAGSGLRGLTVTLLHEQGNGYVPLVTAKETPTADAVINNAKVPSGATELILRVSADTQDPEVVSTYYRCNVELR